MLAHGQLKQAFERPEVASEGSREGGTERRTDARTDGHTDSPCVLQDFVPLRGRSPKKEVEGMGGKREERGDKWRKWMGRGRKGVQSGGKGWLVGEMGDKWRKWVINGGNWW